MKKKLIGVSLVSLAIVLLAACSDTETFEATKPQASESETFEADKSQASESEVLDEADVQTFEAETSEAAESQATESETYGINRTSMEGSTDSEYEISDMLPRPSDDTFIMTVEEAEAFMNKNADAGVEEPDEPEE